MACRIKPKAIKVQCPYCENAPFRVECPGEAPGKKIDDEWVKGSIPREIKCLPYTRDIGIFDGKGWSKIGSDFHSKILDWERIGILRKEEGQKVYYRVVLCPQCKHSFEVYANYTPGRCFAAMWPHLFTKNQANDDIEKYDEVTLTQRIIGNKSLTIWFVCFILLISFVPDIVWKWKILRSSGGYELFIADNWAKLLMRGISCLGLLCILRISFSFIHYLEDSDFENLFKFNKNKSKNSLTFWKNYTRSRFVGVQNKEEPFSPNQVMVIAGIPTVAVLLLIWISDQVVKAEIQTLALLIALLLVPIFYIIGAVAQVLCQKFYHKMTKVTWLFPIKGGGILVSITGLFGSLIYLAKIYHNQPVEYISTTLFELCFWIIISYYIGTGTWNILEIPVYVLKGVKKIPMNLDPLDRFKNLVVLERLGQTSIIGMIVLFFLALALSVCHAFAPIGQRSEWVVIWAQAAFIGLYVAIAIILGGVSGMRLALMALLYILLQKILGSVTSLRLLTQIFPSLEYEPFGGPLHLYQYLKLALFGLFSSYIFYLQFRDIRNILKSLREKYKKQKSEFYQGLMNDIEIQLRELNNHLNKIRIEDSTRRHNLLKSINEIISIIDKINSEHVDVSGYRQIKGFFATTGVMSPFISAIILPIIINYLTQFIPKL